MSFNTSLRSVSVSAAIPVTSDQDQFIGTLLREFEVRREREGIRDEQATQADCIDKHAVDTGSPWADESYGRYGFVLEDPVAYEHLVPAKGKLGIYRVTDDRGEDDSPPGA